MGAINTGVDVVGSTTSDKIVWSLVNKKEFGGQALFLS
jgi:hypothetical protein